ncbi:hypothetical protein ABG067_007680 [Albugo candida]|uniref:Target of rapamycin complex subunit LST8 n=1 Tax=Albugo candida TaxID=65357 RepID=A0A024GH24_9STRA|nr:unnamed protein product [Albugo candida]|eukprot:CCI45647.1 unnamed protein product [Albugo candida]
MTGVVLATAGYDHTIRFWEAASGTCNRTVKYSDSQVNCLNITPDKNYITAAGNPHIRLFEINSNNPNAVSTYDGHNGNVTSLGFQQQGKWMYTSSEDGTLKIWDLRATGFQRSYECSTFAPGKKAGHSSNANSSGNSSTTSGLIPLNSAALHPNQAEVFVADQNGAIRVFDLTADSCVDVLIPDGDCGIKSLDIVKDGSLLVAANNRGKCFFYQPNSGGRYELFHTLQAHNGYILKCQTSSNGRLLATCSSDKTAKIWNIEPKSQSDPTIVEDVNETSRVAQFELIRTLQGHQRWVWDCAFSAVSSYLVTCSSDQSARLWDLCQGEAVRHYNGHHKAVICVALNDSVAD